jgi:hypothetical protein
MDGANTGQPQSTIGRFQSLQPTAAGAEEFLRAWIKNLKPIKPHILIKPNPSESLTLPFLGCRIFETYPVVESPIIGPDLFDT